MLSTGVGIWLTPEKGSFSILTGKLEVADMFKEKKVEEPLLCPLAFLCFSLVSHTHTHTWKPYFSMKQEAKSPSRTEKAGDRRGWL